MKYIQFSPLYKLEKVNGEKFFIIGRAHKRAYEITESIFFVLKTIEEKGRISVSQLINTISIILNITETDLIKLIKPIILETLKLGFIIQDKDVENTKFEAINKYNVGDKIGDYIIKGSISIRKNTQLYLAAKDDSECVLKIFTGNREKFVYLKRFRKEFEILKSLPPHQNIYNLKEYFSSKDLDYGVLDFIKGKSLITSCEENNYNIKEKLDIVLQIVDSVAHLHKNNILHGDIHLSNFMKTDQEVKLIDFGFSHLIGNNTENLHGGIPQFMSPERAKIHTYKFSKTQSSHASEVFQLGIILYYVFVKKLPFSGYNWQALAKSILNDEPNYDLLKDQKIPVKMIDILSKCLKKDPKERYANAHDLLISVKKIVQ